MTKIGENIKNRRQELGIPVQKLADTIGLSRATIYRYENGEIKKMPFDHAISFAKILQCPVDDFLDGDELVDYKIRTIKENVNRKLNEKVLEKPMVFLDAHPGVGKSDFLSDLISNDVEARFILEMYKDLNPEGRLKLYERAKELKGLGYVKEGEQDDD